MDRYKSDDFLREAGGEVYGQHSHETLAQRSCKHRIGYPQIFIDRQTVIQVLFDSLKHKDRVLTNKRIRLVEHGDSDVTVHAEDGTKYTGYILIGADGVHSTIRQEMWRISQDDKSDCFQPDPLAGQSPVLCTSSIVLTALKGLQCESKCIFGTSKRPPSLPASPLQINAFFKNCNYLVLSAPEDRYYWFLFTKVDRVYGKNIARYTKDDELELAKEHFNDELTETTTFGDLYAHRLQTALVSTEDHVFPRWHYRRILTIGDAAHKVYGSMHHREYTG